ncbi:MAG: hypothetical protein C4321_01480, partial [Chloroflexota bacterium]
VLPFPPEAILRETEMHVEGLAIADLDLDLLERARTDGEVRNWSDRNGSPWTLLPELPAGPLWTNDRPTALEAELE